VGLTWGGGFGACALCRNALPPLAKSLSPLPSPPSPTYDILVVTHSHSPPPNHATDTPQAAQREAHRAESSRLAALGHEVELLRSTLSKAAGALAGQGAANEAARQGLDVRRCGGRGGRSGGLAWIMEPERQAARSSHDRSYAQQPTQRTQEAP
jgi:hypothetical protein